MLQFILHGESSQPPLPALVTLDITEALAIRTADADDPSDEVDPPEGRGLDQGALARLQEPLTPEMERAAAIPPDKHAPKAPAASDGPLLGPATTVPVRTYVAFGTSTRGRKGPLSRRVTVPLVPPPPYDPGLQRSGRRGAPADLA